MKIQVFYCIFVVTFAAIVSGNILRDIFPKNPLEEQVLTLFDKWRSGSVLTNLFTLPSLKSISIAEVQANYEDNRLKIDLSIGEMELTGLNNFVIQGLDITQTEELFNISIAIVAPKVGIFARNYEISGRAYYIYPLRGKGAMTVESQDNLLSLNARVGKVDNIYTLIEDFSLNYKIGPVKANFERSSWPINEVLSKEGGKILESYQDQLIEAVRDFVIPSANQYLSNVSFTEILDIIADISINSTIIEDA